MMARLFRMLLLLLLVGGGMRGVAQDDPDSSGGGPLMYDEEVEATITDAAPFDRWEIRAGEGDIVVIEMVASGGLAPLVAVLDNSNNLLFLSDTLPDGTTVPPQVDGTATLEFEAPYDGTYFVITTREGRDEGTTTGSYTLLVRRAGGAGGIADRETLQEVIFRCGPVEAATVTTLLFIGEGSGTYRISVYGLDGFLPVVRLQIASDRPEEQQESCSEPDEAALGDSLTLPGGTSFTVTAPEQAARSGAAGDLRLPFAVTIGSRDSEPGRFVAVIEGLSIADRDDDDLFSLRLGPLATAATLDVYMLGAGRLDPYLIRQPYLTDPEAAPVFCDDAGRRGCEDMPPAVDFALDFADDNLSDLRGDRFDAGVRVAPDNQDVVDIVFMSREEITTGPYALVLIGELPPRADAATD